MLPSVSRHFYLTVLLYLSVGDYKRTSNRIFVQSFSARQPTPIINPNRIARTKSNRLLELYNENGSKDNNEKVVNVAVIGGGLSGLVVGHVLEQSTNKYNECKYNVTVLEASATLGGHIRSIPVPPSQAPQSSTADSLLLNVGHATHMGMFVNLRILLRHFNIAEWPVGKGPNHQPGLFRMLSIAIPSPKKVNNEEDLMGKRVQPSLPDDILSPAIWWEAFWFYFHSYRQPQISLGTYLQQHSYSNKFQTILEWAMRTFEFDKDQQEMQSYSLGTARALLITQVFFQFLLCDAFQGSLPRMIDEGLKEDLSTRISISNTCGSNDRDDHDPPTRQELKGCFENITQGYSLASYFTADYNQLVQRLAAGMKIGSVRTNAKVSKITKKEISPKGYPQYRLEITTTNNETFVVDKIVISTHPAIAARMLKPEDFAQQQEALATMSTVECSGAVGVSIVHAQDLPFAYPPPKNQQPIGINRNNADESVDIYRNLQTGSPSEASAKILGIFDISQLTLDAKTGRSAVSVERNPAEVGEREGTIENHSNGMTKQTHGGWLSVAYPVSLPHVSSSKSHSQPLQHEHEQWFDENNISCAERAVYPWTKATPLFFEQQDQIQKVLQGKDGIYITGQALTAVNKASELQVTNALRLCHDHFGIACPPWRYAFLNPMLPDCNDREATYQASSALEASQLAFKSLVGSFLLTAAVQKLGTEFFD